MTMTSIGTVIVAAVDCFTYELVGVDAISGGVGRRRAVAEWRSRKIDNIIAHVVAMIVIGIGIGIGIGSSSTCKTIPSAFEAHRQRLGRGVMLEPTDRALRPFQQTDAIDVIGMTTGGSEAARTNGIDVLQT